MSNSSAAESSKANSFVAFPRNAWYVAAYPEDIRHELFARRILGDHLVFYRRNNDSLVALQDTCPHRLAPLSRGRLIDDCVECPYHGLRFEGDGKCSFNPHPPGTIPVKMQVRSYPIAERHGLIWIWMGDEKRANPADIPDLSYLTDSATWRTVYSYFHLPFGADLMIDNVMDLSHLEFLHKGSLSTGYREDTRATMTTSEEGGNVRVSWVLRDFVTTAHTREVNDVGARTDSYRDSVWIAPCIVRNELVQVPAGTPRNAGRLRFNTHICTPETHRSMHDFALRSRNFSIDDKEIDRRLLEGQKPVVVDEDGAMLALIQERMVDAPFESFDPVMFHIDTGAVRVRRILDRMVSEEKSSTR